MKICHEVTKSVGDYFINGYTHDDEIHGVMKDVFGWYRRPIRDIYPEVSGTALDHEGELVLYMNYIGSGAEQEDDEENMTADEADDFAVQFMSDLMAIEDFADIYFQNDEFGKEFVESFDMEFFG